MKAYWAIIFLICLAVGVFVILPIIAPTVTANEMIKTSYVTAGDTFFSYEPVRDCPAILR